MPSITTPNERDVDGFLFFGNMRGEISTEVIQHTQRLFNKQNNITCRLVACESNFVDTQVGWFLLIFFFEN